MPDLIHRRTRNAFREACSDFGVVRGIEQAFDNEGFYPADDRLAPILGWYQDGQRRGTFDRHTHEVNWTDPEQVRRVLLTFEEILTWASDEGKAKLTGYLRRDGFDVDDEGRIRSSAVATLAEVPLSSLSDPSAILEHLDRIARTADGDPALAISGSKALIEATTKVVLTELGQPFEERADLPALVRTAQQALALHPESIAPTARGAETVRRLLSNLSQVAIGVAELRNEYGTDHGRSSATGPLGPRHAHLAVGCAGTYCRLLIETLDARRQAEGTQGTSGS